MIESYSKTDRLQAQPPVFRGCNFQELCALAVLSCIAFTPLLGMVAIVTGMYTLCMGLLAISVLLGVIGGSYKYQRMKRGKPDGYYPLRLRLWLQLMGLCRYGLIVRSGHWDVCRTRRS
jgi:conjugative transfer region protein (TIGR03750 family)